MFFTNYALVIKTMCISAILEYREEENMNKLKRYATLVAISALAISPISPAQAEEADLKTVPLTEVLNLPRASFDDNLGDFDVFTAVFMDVWGARPESSVSAISDGYTSLTAFIPTDRAFRKLVKHLTGKAPRSEDAIAAAVASLGAKKLEKVLLYHVVVGNPILSQAALQANGATMNSAGGQSFRVKVDGTKITLIDRTTKHTNAVVLLNKVDINVGNTQVAHGINQVMLPKL